MSDTYWHVYSLYLKIVIILDMNLDTYLSILMVKILAILRQKEYVTYLRCIIVYMFLHAITIFACTCNSLAKSLVVYTITSHHTKWFFVFILFLQKQ